MSTNLVSQPNAPTVFGAGIVGVRVFANFENRLVGMILPGKG